MHNTIWNGVVGSIFQMRQLDVAANNLANADTPGFKADRITFKSYLAQIQEPQFAGERRSIRSIEEHFQTRTGFAPGPLTPTGNSLDFAIDGPGFFVLQTPQGERYTRAGGFRLDEQGQLVSAEGFAVAGAGGAIQTQDSLRMDLTIDEYGTVYQEGQEIGRIRVVEVQNPETLAKVGSRLFAAGRDTRVNDAEAPDVRQGVLEGSNVNLIREMSQVVQAGRAFEAYQRIVAMTNALNEKANQQISQVS
jgi:flagellar basal-body rod protein FlgF